jgi:rSAM/selenodomain-associated transferase 2
MKLEPVLISIVIPAWKELEIQGLVNRYTSLQNVEVIVVLGEDDNVTPLPSGCVVIRGERGRAFQMNCGAKKSRGQIILFLHADTYVLPESFDSVRKSMEDRQHSIGCYSLELKPANFWIWLVSKVANIRTKVFKLPYGDQAIFLRKCDFVKIGGYNNEPILEDVLLVKAAKQIGRLVILQHLATSSSRRWYKEGMYFTTLRNWGTMIAFVLGVSPHTLAKLFKR